MSLRKTICFFILFFVFTLFSSKTYAVSISLSDIPPTITIDPFEFTVSISGAKPATTNYLRVDFYKDSTTHYFGFTKNGSNFYNGSDYLQFPSVTIDNSGSASAILTGKIDSDSSYFEGSGQYILRVRRYTSSGAYSASEADLASKNITIYAPTPSPTSSPTPSPSAKITSANNSSGTVTEKIEKTPSPTFNNNSEGHDTKSTDSSQILGAEIHLATDTPQITQKSPTPTERVLIKSKSVNKSIFIYIGLGVISLCAILLFLKYRKNNEQDF